MHALGLAGLACLAVPARCAGLDCLAGLAGLAGLARRARRSGLVCLACLHGFVVFVALLARSGARSFFALARWDAVISAPRSGRVLERQVSGKSRRSRVEMTFSESAQNGKKG